MFLQTVGGAAHRCSQTPPLTCSMPARDDAAADGWQPPCSSPMLSPLTGAERPAALASTPQSAAASALPAAPGASARRATRASKAASISRPAAARACSRSPRTLKTTSVCGGGEIGFWGVVCWSGGWVGDQAMRASDNKAASYGAVKLVCRVSEKFLSPPPKCRAHRVGVEQVPRGCSPGWASTIQAHRKMRGG